MNLYLVVLMRRPVVDPAAVTAHQAFLTREALAAIAGTTLDNIGAWRQGAPVNLVEP